MTNWNPDQLLAITSRQKNVMVSASAGAGKTTVLIERLVRRVLDDHIQINEILAMTFTEAAASEMKKRLADQLHKQYNEASDPILKAYIQVQLSQLQNAAISTIHSFCLSILQKYYYVLDLPAARVNRILDQAQVTLCRNQALETAFQIQRKQQDPRFIKLCEYFSSRSESDDAFQLTIMRLATAAASQADPNQFFAFIKAAYQPVHSIAELPSSIQDNFYDYHMTIVDMLDESLQEIMQLLHQRYPQENKKIDAMQIKCSGVKPIKTALQNQQYEAYRIAFINLCRFITPTTPNKEDPDYDRLRKQIQGMEDGILKVSYGESAMLRDLQDLAEDVDKLIEMTMDYRDAFASEKVKAEGIDFDDMEHFALAILQANHDKIASVYRNRFKEIMVDEFQDSNDVQHTLVKLICQKDNVFRVGDIKQSIYGFRHAKPDLMRGLMTHAQELDDIIYLRNNYRSKQMIVDFSNQLFDQLMNINGFQSSYQQSDYVATGADHQQIDNVPILFHGLDYAALKESAGYAIHTQVCKASYIASQILKLKQEHHREWKDFVVLVRSNARKADMKVALDELRIPCFVDVKTGFYQSDGVQVLLSFLRMCINPHDDISFIAVLLSAIGNVDHETIAQAAIHKQKQESYYTYFKAHPFPTFQILQEHIEQIHQHTLSDEILSIYQIHDFYQTKTSLQDKTNLDLLYQMANRMEKTEGISITGFLKHVDQVKDMETAEAIPIGSDEDVVRVMSIHQSKGLQFPVVFIWSNNNQENLDFKDMVMTDEEIGIAMKHMDLPQRYVRTTIPRLAMEQKKNRESLEEEMRILYVALTRAQEEMHIVDYVKDPERYKTPLTRSIIYQRGGYTSWILHRFLNEQNPLFHYQSVYHMWNTEINTQIAIEKSVTLPAYDYPITSVSLQTASKTHPILETTLNLQPSGFGSTRGTALHHIIASSVDEIPASAFGYTLQEKDRQEILSLQNHPLYQEAKQMKHDYEFPYTVKDGNRILHGYMDFVAYDDKHAIIIDFKSDQSKDEKELLTLYRDQLLQYQKAFQLLYPKLTVKTYVFALTFGKMLLID